MGLHTADLLKKISAVTGTPLEELSYIHLLISIKGFISMQDVMQLQSIGIPITTAFSNILNLDRERAIERIKDGKITFAQFEQAIVNICSDWN